MFLTATAFPGPFGELGLSYAQCTPLTHSTFYGVSIHGLASYLVQLEFSLHMRQEHWTGGVLRPGFEQIWYWGGGGSTDLVFRTCEYLGFQNRLLQGHLAMKWGLSAKWNLFLFQSIKTEPIKGQLSKLICMSICMQVHIQTLVRIQM